MQMQQEPQMQLEQTSPAVPLPQIYNVPEVEEQPSITEEIKKYDMMGLVYPWIKYPLTMIGTCAGMAYGVEKFSQACSGNYEKSLVGRAANFGDKLESSKFVKSKPFQGVWGAGKNAIGKVKHFFRNSDLLNAMFKTPSQPEWAMPKDEMLGMKHRVVHEFNNIAKTLKWTGEGYTQLAELGLDKTDKKFLKEFFGDAKLSTMQEKASNAVRLNRLGLDKTKIRSIIDGTNATEMVKTKELEHIGLTKDFLKKIEKNTASLKDIVTVEKACDKGRNIRIGAGHKSWLGPLQIFERKAGLDEISNRLKSMMKGAKTKTGRAFATFLQKCHRGFTFGGHKMNVIFFVSPMLVESLMDVKKAEPNEKLGTAAHGLIHSVSWVFTFPLALKLMHHIGGAQYAGMGEEKVRQYRKLISDFNENVKKGVYNNRGEYKKALEELMLGKDGKPGLKALKHVEGQNLLTRISRKVASFLTIDLETIKPYADKNNILLKTARKIPNFFKNVVGVPMRFILWGVISMGVFDTVINKGIKGCFGNFYDRFKEEEFVNAKKEQKKFLKEDLKTRLYEANQRKVLGLENKAVAGNFSKENISSLAPSIIDQRPKNNEPEKLTEQASQSFNEQNIDNQPLKEALNKDDGILQQKQPEEIQPVRAAEQMQNEVNIPEETVLSEPLNTKIAEPENRNPEVKKDFVSEKEYKNPEVLPQIEPEKDKYTYIPNNKPLNIQKEVRPELDNYTYIPSSENVLKKNSRPEDKQKYIPSQIGAKFNKTFDNSGLQAALHRADLAEQRAIQTLAGNFNSYS